MPVRFMCSQLSGETCFSSSSGIFRPCWRRVCRRPAEIDGVPMNDGADHEVEPRSTERLTVKGSIPDFAALVEEDGAFELVGGFALVEPGLAAPAQGRV
jgi:hypothetical protein